MGHTVGNILAHINQLRILPVYEAKLNSLAGNSKDKLKNSSLPISSTDTSVLPYLINAA